MFIIRSIKLYEEYKKNIDDINREEKQILVVGGTGDDRKMDDGTVVGQCWNYLLKEEVCRK